MTSGNNSSHARTSFISTAILLLVCAFALMFALFPSRVSKAAETGLVTSASARLPAIASVQTSLAWLPPGSEVTPSPSDAIFPPQTIAIRFNHRKHVEEQKLSCKVCHVAAYQSEKTSDRLFPSPTSTCDNCHDVNHADTNKVYAGSEPNGQCSFCHVGYEPGKSVARTVVPTPNLRFNHKKHLDRNVQCAQCHGQVEKFELATRDQMPRMAGCFGCHGMTGAAQGQAKSACITCHLTEPNGTLKTEFEQGAKLSPPSWLRNAEHTPDWISRHKKIAGEDSKFCSNCHTQDDCTSCHDGKVRNRQVHPNDWISMHPQAARQDNPRCVSCHQLQTFCADCHRRLGIARDVASGNTTIGRRFHPPSSEWTTAPRGANHHSWEAMRNMNACVSCHTERDCATCHATKGFSGGMGVNPHPSQFASNCSTAMKKNSRSCLVCHQSNDRFLGSCR